MRTLLNAIDLAATILRIDAIRIAIAICCGIFFDLIFQKKRIVLKTVLTVIIFHGLSLFSRWYDCPLDMPLGCKCDGFYREIRLAEILNLSNDYILFWTVFIVLAGVIGGIIIYYMRKIANNMEAEQSYG